MMANLTEIVHTSMGRALKSTQELAPQTVCLSSRAHCAVLYSSFCRLHCSWCYAKVPDEEKQICSHCQSYVVCASCDRLGGEALRKWHETECGLFCSIPAGLRSGDTDYLRFVLRYLTIRVNGSPPPPAPTLTANDIDQLCDNQSIQDPDFLCWAKSLAQKLCSHVRQPPGISEEMYVRLICQIRCNALGFPFTQEETIGWALDVQASMLNHSCAPNCFIQCSKDGSLQVTTKRQVQQSEELCISYVDLDTRDKQERKDHLYEVYRFVCECPLCK